MSKRPTTFSMRMPEDLNEKITAYAAQNNCTKAEAMSRFARAGIELEENGLTPAATDTAAPDSQVTPDASQEALAKIQERLEALQNLPTIEPDANKSIVPADIKDKIQAYSTEHECSDYESLTYYARIGVQMSEKDRPASAAEVAELARRLDVLAQDGKQKSEQMTQMVELLTSIREYTKPEELELPGELADQEAEDVEDAELTDEEKQRIADEHTRKVVSDVMGEYLAKQEADQKARESELASQQQNNQPNPLATWVPILVAIIVSLVIGIIVILVR